MNALQDINGRFKKGVPPWNKGMKRSWLSPTEFKKGVSVSPATQFKKGEMSEKQMGSQNSFWKGGKPHCRICTVPLSNYRSKICHGCRNAENHHKWKGGTTKYKKNIAMLRDNYTCQICGFNEKEALEVDHIIPKSVRPDLQFSIENLVTLCENCHRKKTNRELKTKAYKL